jgi:hypothetical protein
MELLMTKKPLRRRSRTPHRIVHGGKAVSLMQQLRLFNEWSSALCAELNIEESVTFAFQKHFTNRLASEGNFFLKECRQLFVQGVKVLGNDSPAFSPYWELSKAGYPKTFSFIFIKLKEFGHRIRANPKSANGLLSRVRILLSLLYAPYGFLIPLSKRQESEAKKDFLSRIDVWDDSHTLDWAEVLSAKLMQALWPVFGPLDTSLNFDLTKSTGKSRGPVGSPEIPLRSVLGTSGMTPVNNIYVQSYPVGSVHVLGERAGKTRVITSYDGRLMANDLRDKLVKLLDKLPGDFSLDQSQGHERVRKMTSMWMSDDRPIFSTDLTAFTDSLYPSATNTLLRALDMEDFKVIQSSPIMLDNDRIFPQRYLMGLRGTFELATIVHHSIATEVAGINGYAMCGDDLVFRGDIDKFPTIPVSTVDKVHLQVRNPEEIEALSAYNDLAHDLGLYLNSSKTVISRSTAIFCGKVFHCGLDVTPHVPPFHSWVGADFYCDVPQLVTKTVEFAHQACSKLLRSRLFGIIKRQFGRLYTGLPLPMGLPVKLGGFGFFNNTSLIVLLEDPVHNSSFVRLPTEEPEVEQMHFNYPPWDPLEGNMHFLPWIKNLGKKVVPKFKKPNRLQSRRGYLSSFFSPDSFRLTDITSALEYFYSGK